MKDDSIMHLYFKSIENGDIHALINLYDDFALIFDPILGELRGDLAKYYVPWLCSKIQSIRFSMRDVRADLFFASADWSAVIVSRNLKNEMVVHNGSVSIEMKGDKIYHQINEISLLSFFSVTRRCFGLFQFNFFLNREKFRQKLIDEIKDFVALQKSMRSLQAVN